MAIHVIKHKIRQYKRKYYLRQLVKGGLITLLSFISLFLVVILLENSFWFPSTIRLILLLALLLIFLIPLVTLVIMPLLKLLNIGKNISDIDASRDIGNHFPEISDKLVNYLQISELTSSDTSLLAAAIEQKTRELNVFQFQQAVDFSILKKYLYAFLVLITVVFLLSFINTPAVTESSKRIMLYDQHFKKKAPFEFLLQNTDLNVFRNENLELKLKVTGESIPESVYILTENRRIKLAKLNNDSFGFKFNSVNNPMSFQFEAAGYLSDEYNIRLLDRPELRTFSIDLDYPRYTRLDDETIANTGNLLIPEGTRIKWNLNTTNTSSAHLIINEKASSFENKTDKAFLIEKVALSDFTYNLQLKNEFGSNRSEIEYHVKVVKDEYPQIQVVYLPDTILYQSIELSGSLHDDYGVSAVSLSYRKGFSDPFRKVRLLANINQQDRKFYFSWPMDTLALEKSQTLEFYLSALDNDGINGPKESRTQRFYFQKPDEKAIENMLEEKSRKSEEKLDQAKSEVESLNDKLKELEERLKTKNKMEWQEEKMAEDILKDREELEKSIEELKEQFDNLKKSQEEFKEQDQSIKEKSEQLQSLMNELLDEKTKKLYDELKKLLEENANSDQVRNQLEKLQLNEKNLENELERALELFKRLKLESMLGENIKELESLAEKQEKISQMEKDENVASQQEEIKEKFQELEEKIEKMEQLNQEMKNPEPLQDFEQDEQDIKKNLEELSEQLEQNSKPNKATKSKQQETSEQMKNLAQKMSEMQSNMEMDMMQENIDNLRNILDNLVKLSFDQEEIIDEFRKVRQSDPRFIELSQEQLQLIDNAQIIEDSLYSLSERVFQISAFVTREVGAINENLESAMNELRERNKGKAMSHQQFAMTSVNNLALLLSDVLQQMQNAMSMASGNPSEQPSLSELQKQLGQQIEELKKSGKSGRELSEELARMAAEQEMIRQQMKALQEKLNGQPDGEKIGNSLNEIIKEMEESELELVNKQLTQKLIERQKKLVTKMLEAEESMREQKIDPEREGETADNYQRKNPPAYEEYLKARENEIELLKTIPIELNPFYKKEVNDYFRRLSEEE
tara:strand:+ start:208251 stop:211505 length:3255 start_codon:yes stop_codon:yes gene_type:complete